MRDAPSGSILTSRKGIIIGLALVAIVAATSVSAAALSSADSDAVSEVEAAISDIFTGQCVTSDDATSRMLRSMDAAGYGDWTVDSRAGGGDCVAAGIDGSTATVVLVPVDHPDVSEAMGDVRDELMDRCMNEREASNFIGEVLSGVGVDEFEVRRDGPFVFPDGEEQAVREHVESGCFVYSGAGRDEDGKAVYYISGEAAARG